MQSKFITSTSSCSTTKENRNPFTLCFWKLTSQLHFMPRGAYNRVHPFLFYFRSRLLRSNKGASIYIYIRNHCMEPAVSAPHNRSHQAPYTYTRRIHTQTHAMHRMPQSIDLFTNIECQRGTMCSVLAYNGLLAVGRA